MSDDPEDVFDAMRAQIEGEQARLDAQLDEPQDEARGLGQGGVALGPAAAKLLFPRLRALGFVPQAPETEWTWRGGIALEWRGRNERPAVLTIETAKSGGGLEVKVVRTPGGGAAESFDVRTAGLEAAGLEYADQDEANAVLERVAAACEGPVLAWLEDGGRA